MATTANKATANKATQTATQKAAPAPQKPAAPAPQATAAQETPKMDTAAQETQNANGTTKRGPGRPPSGTPKQTPEERAAKDKARRQEFAQKNTRDKLLHRLQAASEHCDAVLDDVKRSKLPECAELAGIIGDAFVSMYKQISEQPDNFELERRKPGERGPRKVPTYAVGSKVVVREKFADKWKARLGTDALEVLGQDADYVILPTRAGFQLAVPVAHVQPATEQPATAAQPAA